MKILLFLLFFSAATLSAQDKMENLKIVWPEEYEWKVGNSQEDEKIHFVELVPGNESIEEWTIIGTMMAIKGLTGVPMEEVMNTYYEQVEERTDKASLTVLDQEKNGESPYILFKIESSSYKTDHPAESQLYYIVQGQSSIFSNSVAIKEGHLKEKFVKKWSKVFLESEFVYF